MKSFENINKWNQKKLVTFRTAMLRWSRLKNTFPLQIPLQNTSAHNFAKTILATQKSNLDFLHTFWIMLLFLLICRLYTNFWTISTFSFCKKLKYLRISNAFWNRYLSKYILCIYVVYSGLQLVLTLTLMLIQIYFYKNQKDLKW